LLQLWRPLVLRQKADIPLLEGEGDGRMALVMRGHVYVEAGPLCKARVAVAAAVGFLASVKSLVVPQGFLGVEALTTPLTDLWLFTLQKKINIS
jgi:hypothetical protein